MLVSKEESPKDPSMMFGSGEAYAVDRVMEVTFQI